MNFLEDFFLQWWETVSAIVCLKQLLFILSYLFLHYKKEGWSQIALFSIAALLTRFLSAGRIQRAIINTWIRQNNIRRSFFNSFCWWQLRESFKKEKFRSDFLLVLGSRMKKPDSQHAEKVRYLLCSDQNFLYTLFLTFMPPGCLPSFPPISSCNT